jgi:hypothetical protein
VVGEVVEVVEEEVAGPAAMSQPWWFLGLIGVLTPMKTMLKVVAISNMDGNVFLLLRGTAPFFTLLLEGCMLSKRPGALNVCVAFASATSPLPGQRDACAALDDMSLGALGCDVVI